MADGDRTHHVGDSCLPDGHRSDPEAASALNDQLLEHLEIEDCPEVDIEAVMEGGMLTDRQAALFAAMQHYGPVEADAMVDPAAVRTIAEEFHTWLTQDQDDPDGR